MPHIQRFQIGDFVRLSDKAPKVIKEFVNGSRGEVINIGKFITARFGTGGKLILPHKHLVKDT